MRAEEALALPSPDGLPFREALVWRRWNSSPGSRKRVVTWTVALVLLVPVHVLFFAVTGSAWSLLAVPANPAALYLSLRGWAYADLLVLGIATVIALVGNYLPFYLA